MNILNAAFGRRVPFRKRVTSYALSLGFIAFSVSMLIGYVSPWTYLAVSLGIVGGLAVMAAVTGRTRSQGVQHGG